MNSDKFTGLPTIEKRRKTWIAKSVNCVVRYIYSDEIEMGPETRYIQSDFIHDCNAYAIANNITTMTATKIGRTISELFAGQISREKVTFQGKQTLRVRDFLELSSRSEKQFCWYMV